MAPTAEASSVPSFSGGGSGVVESSLMRGVAALEGASK
jgi:hypothetical protein